MTKIPARVRRECPGLIFPELKLVREGPVKVHRTRLKKTKSGKSRREVDGWTTKQKPLYRLDWEGFEERVGAACPYPTVHNHTWSDFLPEKYEKEVTSALFIYDKKYFAEIERNMKRASEEWKVERIFDTVIAEMCLEPAVAHTRVVFRLLEDLLYNEEHKMSALSVEGKHRGEWGDPRRYYISVAMGMRFWLHQTGELVVPWAAGIDRLEGWRRRRTEKDSKGRWVREEEEKDKEREPEAFVNAIRERTYPPRRRDRQDGTP